MRILCVALVLLSLAGCQHLTRENMDRTREIVATLSQVAETVQSLESAWKAFEKADGIEAKGEALLEILSLLGELFDAVSTLNPNEVQDAYAYSGIT